MFFEAPTREADVITLVEKSVDVCYRAVFLLDAESLIEPQFNSELL